MISDGRDEILSRFSGIPAVLQILHELCLAITCKKFHLGKAGFLYCTAGFRITVMKLSHVITSARLRW